MTLHYAPTTPEEEELAIALALSASLSSAAAHKPSPPAAAPRPAPASSSSTNSLLQRPAAPSLSPQRHATSTSPSRNRWRSDSSSSAAPASHRHPPPSLDIPPASIALGRSLSPGPPSRPPAMQYPPPQFAQYGNPQPYHPPTYPPPSLQQHQQHPGGLCPAAPHLPPILPPPPPRSKSAVGPGGMFGRGNSGGAGPSAAPAATTSTSASGGVPSRPPPQSAQPLQLHSDPDACAGCGRGFGLFTRSWVTGLGRKWHPGCFKCGFCKEPISSGAGHFSYQMHPGDPLPYHPDCYRHVHHPICHVCGTYIAPTSEGVISYRESGFWREKYCTTHRDGDLTRCCACSRLQKQGEEWAPLPDGRPLCLQCLSSVVLDTPDAQPLYDEVLGFFTREMRLPHAYKPPLLLVDGPTLNAHAEAEGRDDPAEAPVFHVRGLCVAHVYSHIPSIIRGAGGVLRSVATELLNPAAGVASAGSHRSGGGAGPVVHCHVKVLLLLYGLPRLLSGSIMAHELMHAWLRMEGVVGLSSKVEEGLCQLLACLWLDRQHELLKAKPEEQRLASFFSYQIRTDTSDVYGGGFREAMEAFQAVGFTSLIDNVKRYGRFTAS